VLGGYVLLALVGVTCARLPVPHPALALMHATRTLHPPATGLALTAVIGSAEIRRAGYLYVPALSTAGPLLLSVVVVYHRISRARRAIPNSGSSSGPGTAGHVGVRDRRPAGRRRPL
jgi:CBS-domain-containing membrane protein